MSAAPATESHRAVGSSPAELPDVNVETYPFDAVVAHLEKVAYFNALARPQPRERPTLTTDPEDYFGIHGGYGLVVDSALHRFESTVGWPGADGAPRVSQTVGPPTGRLTGRWMLCPPGFGWQPGVEPPPVLFDPWRPQHFVLLDTEIDFGSAAGLAGYGIGRTYPITVGGDPRVLAGAVGNLTRGRGGLREVAATFALNGEIRDLAFHGYVSVRAADPAGVLRSERELAAPAASGHDPGATYLVMRGQKRDRTVRTEYAPPLEPGRVRLVTPAEMRSAEYRFTAGGGRGLRARRIERQVIGGLEATVTLDILAPPGTAERPNDFSTVNVYTFSDAAGGTVGTVTARVELGKSFGLELPGLPGQGAMRYAGFGPIVGGSGRFEGVAGSLAVNSAIGIRPHALSMLNVLRIIDPDGRFHA